VICPTCGTESRPGAKFCAECATPLAAACPSCGTVNAPGSKFCAECATPLVPGARPAASPGGAVPSLLGQPASERRLVSVLFADIVGFTPFAAARDAEDVRETLTRYFELASEVIGQYGGTVEKFIGDAVMAVWGAPVAREDDAERAVRAAIDLLDGVRTLGSGIQARAGVLTGEAAVTIGATNQGLVAGDIVNTASRLQSAAAPGTVLVGESTHRSASGAIVFEDAGEFELKGKDGPVHAWRAVRVVAQVGGRNRADTLEAPFVGRDQELRLLKDLFQATSRELRPRLVSVVGPGGIGKSRLAWEFLKYLDGLVEQVWWHAGRSPAYGDGVTFWALGEMIRARAGLLESDDEATTRVRIAATVREHVPDPGEAAWIEPALLALLGVEAQVASDQLFAAWRTFFERLADTAPVVMVFEDLHHADKGMLDFIDHLMEWSRNAPITVVTLARPELMDRRADWGAGKRSFTSIYLEPLPPAEMERLLAGLVPGLPAKAAAAIVARADGVPLYAVETVRMLLAQGRLVLEGQTYTPVGDLHDLAVPETLTALIAARLDGLDAADRSLVEDAAVLGQSFSLPAVSAVSGTPEAELEPRLRALVRRELLVHDVDPRSPERGQYAFVQALVREVAYNTLSKRDRKVRHLAAARYFEQLGTDELAGGLAGHYLVAHQLAGDPAEADALAAQARVALRAAADRAAALGSHEQALAFIDQALQITSDPVDRAVLHDRAFVSATAGLDVELVLRHADGALSERRRTGDRHAISSALARAARAQGGWNGDPKGAYERLMAEWPAFEDLEDTPAGAELTDAIGATLSGQDDPRAMAWIDRCLVVAERLHMLDVTVRALVRKGSRLIAGGRPREGMIVLRGAHEQALERDLRDSEETARVLLTFFNQWSEPAVGLAIGREGMEIGERRGSRAYIWSMAGNSCVCAFRVGDWDWAATLLEELFGQESSPGPRSELFVDRAILRSMRGEDASDDIEAARQIVAETGMNDPQFASYQSWAVAWAAFGRGDLAEARRLGVEAAAATSYFAPLGLPLAIRSALWSGDAVGAAEALATLRGSGFAGAALDADLRAAQAGIDALEGRTAAAVAGYREAVAAYRQLGLEFDEAAAAVDLATLLPADEVALPDLAAVVARGRETLERLGARPFLARLDGARRAGRRPASAIAMSSVTNAS
jgi:class 3 adenylate cyclase